MTTTKFSISAANRITGKSRTTLNKHIKQGRLSYEVDADGNKIIDRSELIRVYGDACDFSREEGLQTPSVSKGGAEQTVQQQLNSVQLQLDIVNKERDRERSQLQQQIDYLQDSLGKAQETANKAMLLLEHKPRGDWEDSFKALERRIANQEEQASAKLLKGREEGKREALSDLKSKSWPTALLHLLISDFKK